MILGITKPISIRQLKNKHSIPNLRKSPKYQLLGIYNCYTFGNFAKYI